MWKASASLIHQHPQSGGKITYSYILHRKPFCYKRRCMQCYPRKQLSKCPPRFLLRPVPNDQFEGIEQMGSALTLQHREPTHPPRLDPMELLVHQGRSEGCLLHYFSGQQSSMIPEVCSGREQIPVHLPPFGLSCAPWVFTKVTIPVVSYLSGQGVQMVIYLDDILLLVKSLPDIQSHLEALTFLLENLGFVINQEKSVNLTDTLPGNECGLIFSRGLARGEDKEHLAGGNLSPWPTSHDSLDALSVYWETQCNSTDHSPCSIILPMPPARLTQGSSRRQPGLRDKSEPMAQEELMWWVQHLSHWNGKTILHWREH